MTRRDALVQVIECLHAEIAALKANDIAALETATTAKLSHLEIVAANDDAAPPDAETAELGREADRLNESARIYVNLMAANVRRRLHDITGGTAGGAYGATYRAA